MCERAQTYKAQREGKGEGERERPVFSDQLGRQHYRELCRHSQDRIDQVYDEGFGELAGFQLSRFHNRKLCRTFMNEATKLTTRLTTKGC